MCTAIGTVECRSGTVRVRAKRWRRSSGQTNEEKQPITHRQRMWYNP